MERPDLVMTTYHMDLDPLTEVAKELGLPLQHLPTDLDVKIKEVFGKEKPDYEYFNTFLPDNNEMTINSVRTVPSAQRQYFKVKPESEVKEVAGMALRPEFYISRGNDEIAAIKKEKGIDPEAKVILVLAGDGEELLILICCSMHLTMEKNIT